MFASPARRSIQVIRSTQKTGLVQNERKVIRRAFSSRSLLQSDLQVGDRVILRWRSGRQFRSKLTKPLREDSETIVDNHIIRHSTLINKPSDTRLTSTTKDGLKKIHVTARHPTLDEFTSLSPRRVAPIYATYASTITSILDIHTEPTASSNDATPIIAPTKPTLQILEAGTGHGSLTIHLSRAIAPSNPPVTPDAKPTPSLKAIYRAGEESDDEVLPSDLTKPTIQAYRSTRRAVLHTIDIDAHNRRHADQLIRSYRNGIYWPHIDFHVADVKDWIRDRLLQDNGAPFLDIAILDMPGVENYVASVTPAVKEGGLLLVFVPQITQVASCVQEITVGDLGLRLERVLELGDGVSTGRLWDVRMATLKNERGRLSRRVKKEVVDEHSRENGSAAEDQNIAMPTVGTIPPMVCRPIVGEMTRGGGFVGLWKKVSPNEQDS